MGTVSNIVALTTAIAASTKMGISQLPSLPVSIYPAVSGAKKTGEGAERVNQTEDRTGKMLVKLNCHCRDSTTGRW